MRQVAPGIESEVRSKKRWKAICNEHCFATFGSLRPVSGKDRDWLVADRRADWYVTELVTKI